MTETDARVPRLRDAVLAVTAARDVDAALRQLVDAAARLAGARTAKLEVRAPDGGVRTVTLRGDDTAPAAPWLELPVTVKDGAYGTLTVAGSRRPGGFTQADEELIAALAAVAGAAIENAGLYQRVRERGRWLEAVREINTALLEGSDLPEVLQSTTHRARSLVAADLATVAVPSGPDTLVLRAADGKQADRIEGTEFPRSTSVSGEVIASGQPIRIDDVAKDPRAAQPVVRLGVFGPALFVPLVSGGTPFGTLLVANLRGGRAFDDDDLSLVSTLASHASLAVAYADSQERVAQLGLLEERERIALQMHESVIQRIFDTGLSIENAAMRLGDREPEIVRTLTGAVDQLDRVIREIRTAIFATEPERAQRMP